MAEGDAEGEKAKGAKRKVAPARPAPQPEAMIFSEPEAHGLAASIHSKAFENLVEDPNDIVGLLAYAKFKQSIHEAACNGTVVDRPSRNLTPAMVEVLRSAAEQMLGQVVDDGIQAAAPDIEKSALKAAMEAQFSDLTATIKTERTSITDRIDHRTSFLPSFLTNLAAWVVTLILAVVIVYLFNRPSPEESILKVANPTVKQLDQEEPRKQGHVTGNRSDP